MSSDNLYRELPVLEDFTEIHDPSRYVDIPEDWYVVVADVVNSTELIRSGRYQSVNLTGVSVIAAILNIAGDITLPYIFGGDGATLCIPASLLMPAQSALAATRHLADTEYGLTLRVGLVPVRVLLGEGKSVRVARHRVSRYCIQAAFTGDGIEHAESMLKDDDDRVLRPESIDDTTAASYQGLECRWRDIPSRHGETTALIIRALHAADAKRNGFYSSVTTLLYDIYGEAAQFCPVYEAGLRMAWSEDRLAYEAKLKSGGQQRTTYRGYLWTMRLQNLLGWLFMTFGLRLQGVDWGRYKPDVVANSDYRKFDGTYRCILSGTAAQRLRLTEWLAAAHAAGDCVYGLHVSKSAHITCLVSHRQGDHYHFVDGADGGYALAALQMKQQLRER